MTTVTDQRKPILSLPADFPYAWAADWGEDRYGLYAAFAWQGVKQYLRWLDPGEFLMGSPEGEPQRDSAEYQHPVELTEGCWLADTACTQELWQAVTGKNPARFKGAQLPVETVSWDNCRKFIEKINQLIPGLALRLPTEAEWEYACRAGTATPFAFGENITTDQVNYDGNYPYHKGKKGIYREKTVLVKSLPPNAWGLYEMHGNVWEWCADWWDENYYRQSPRENPAGPQKPGKGAERVVRGGSWFNYGGRARSAYRNRDRPDFADFNLGFRLSRGHSARPASQA